MRSSAISRISRPGFSPEMPEPTGWRSADTSGESALVRGVTGTRTRRSASGLVLLAALALGACESAQRRCAAFYHPLGGDWATLDALGASARYSGSDGSEVALTLASREDNAPYTATHPSDEERIVCELRSTRRYELLDAAAAGAATALRITFLQREPYATPLEQQNVSIALRPESPPDEALDYGFLFDISNPEALYGEENSDELAVTRVLRDASVGGVERALAIEQRLLDTTTVAERAPNPSAAITRVVFARGVGLVEFERLDGIVYTRGDGN